MGEVKKERKICPLLATSSSGLTDITCGEEKCAWWNEQLKQCAVLSFSLLMMGQLVEA